MIFLFPGEKIINGDIEKIQIEAESEDKAIEIYNKKFPQFDFNKKQQRMFNNARRIKYC